MSECGVELVREPGRVSEELEQLVGLVDGIVGQGPVVVEEVVVAFEEVSGVIERYADEIPPMCPQVVKIVSGIADGC